MENFSRLFQNKKEKKKNMMKLSFMTHSRLSFYHRLPVAVKCLKKCVIKCYKERGLNVQ